VLHPMTPSDINRGHGSVGPFSSREGRLRSVAEPAVSVVGRRELLANPKDL
jgi:hypothetical protein